MTTVKISNTSRAGETIEVNVQYDLGDEEREKDADLEIIATCQAALRKILRTDAVYIQGTPITGGK